jgi:hypothetical protein
MARNGRRQARFREGIFLGLRKVFAKIVEANNSSPGPPHVKRLAKQPETVKSMGYNY